VSTRSLEEPYNCLEYTDITRYHKVAVQHLVVEGCRFRITCEELLSQQSTKPGCRSPPDMFIPSHPVQPITANLQCTSAVAPQAVSRDSYQNTPNMRLSLAASAPDVLQQTIPLRQSVQGIVALAHGSYKSAEGVDLALAGESAVLVNLANGDLDGRMVLGLDNAVGGTALAGDVTAKTVGSASLPTLRGASRWSHFELWRDVQVDEFSLIVFHLGEFFACEFSRSLVVSVRM
jgi:hypothetical protein